MKNKTFSIVKWTIPGYLMILAIALLTPLHSDDFGTQIGGFPNFAGHFQKYMTWSGRLTADYLASYIMWIDSHFIRSALNAFGTYALILTIAKLPFSLSTKKIDKNYPFIFYLVMSIMWTCSPNLGQSSFWIVGATNYVWTNLFLIMLIDIMATYILRDNTHSINYYAGVFILAVIAGCGNENMSVVLVGTCALFLLYTLFLRKSQIKLAVISFMGSSAGAALLLLAPGNFRRMSMEGDWWQNATWGYKLWLWAFKKMPFILQVDWPVIAIIVALLLSVLVSGSIKQSLNSNKALYLAIPLFIFLAFIANFVLIASPAYPPRAANGQFILLLCSLSFAALIAIQSSRKQILIPLLAVIFLTALYAYVLMARAYYFVAKQEEIRQEIMKKERDALKTSVIIPEYKFRTLFNEGDKFDMFKPKQLPYFFGLKEVGYINPNFDYSVIKTDGQPIKIKLGDYAVGVKAWTYNNNLINNDYVIVIMLDHYNKEVWSQHDSFIGKSKSVVIDGKRYMLRSEPALYAINGKAYFALNIGNNKLTADIKEIKK